MHLPDPNPQPPAPPDEFLAPTDLPIDGALDLHGFKPRDVKDVVLEYLAACQHQGLLEVRLIHGKGIGNLRRTVHALLTNHPQVLRFADASAAFGGLGATIVQLRPPTTHVIS